MAKFPGAIQKPITASKGRRPMAAFNRVNLHVAVSESDSLFGYFNKTGIPDSHFYVRKDGTVEQYVDTSMQAFADRDGNDATISVETQGGLHDAQGEPWTVHQVDALARLYAWAVQTHGMAVQIASDSFPGATSKGLSWHRLGIDPWRKAGSMRYSKSRGKVCPGNAKIGQVPEIFGLAKTLLAGGGAGPAPKEDDMPTADEIAAAVWNRVLSAPNAAGLNSPAAAQAFLKDIAVSARRGTGRAVWTELIQPPNAAGLNSEASAEQFLRDIAVSARKGTGQAVVDTEVSPETGSLAETTKDTQLAVEEIQAKVAHLAAAVQLLADNIGGAGTNGGNA